MAQGDRRDTSERHRAASAAAYSNTVSLDEANVASSWLFSKQFWCSSESRSRGSMTWSDDETPLGGRGFFAGIKCPDLTP